MLHTISSDVNGTIRPARKAGCSGVADGTRLSDWVYQRPVWQSYQTEVVCTEFGKLFCRKNSEKVLHLKSLLLASMQWGWRGRRLKTRGSSSGKVSAVPAQTLTQPLPHGQTGNFNIPNLLLRTFLKWFCNSKKIINQSVDFSRKGGSIPATASAPCVYMEIGQTSAVNGLWSLANCNVVTMLAICEFE